MFTNNNFCFRRGDWTLSLSLQAIRLCLKYVRIVKWKLKRRTMKKTWSLIIICLLLIVFFIRENLIETRLVHVNKYIAPAPKFDNLFIWLNSDSLWMIVFGLQTTGWGKRVLVTDKGRASVLNIPFVNNIAHRCVCLFYFFYISDRTVGRPTIVSINVIIVFMAETYTHYNFTTYISNNFIISKVDDKRVSHWTKQDQNNAEKLRTHTNTHIWYEKKIVIW